MGKLGKELIESMQQAAKHANGRKVRGLRVTKVEIPDEGDPPRLEDVATPLLGSVPHSPAHPEELGAGPTTPRRARGGLSPRDQAAA